MTTEDFEWLRLHLTPGLGRAGLSRLMAAFGTPSAILAAAPDRWTSTAGIRETVARGVPGVDDPRLLTACRNLEKMGARILPATDPDYPPLLRAIHDPPALLYLRGTLPFAEALAVVGSRRASESGRRLATDLCAELASYGVTVVSGLARGVDTAAHLGALEGGGSTVGVLGCGIDRVYPPENAKLFQRIVAENGAIVSEYPPGTDPLPGHFPGRNRVISGLCRGVLIVEAAEGSGSLITADFALEQGREVFAAPGSVHSPVSRGSNQLLKEGAHLVTSAADILQVLWPETPSREKRHREETVAATLSGAERKVFDLLGATPLHIDDLVRTSALTPMEVSAILLHLELKGGAKALPGMRFVRG